MKKIIYTLLAITLVVSACKKEDEDTAPTNTTTSGCTDNTALNYNAIATVDDGSCQYDPNSVLGPDWIMQRMLINGWTNIIDNNGNVLSSTPMNQIFTEFLAPTPLHFLGDGTLTYSTGGTGTWNMTNSQLSMTINSINELFDITLLNANQLTIIDSNYVDTSFVQDGMNFELTQMWIAEYER
jgi:hypothetical protein